MAPSFDGRDQAGRFVVGSTPNPHGKPRGTRNRASALLDSMAERGARDVLQAVLTAAREGDTAAASLILSRIWPARKGRSIVFDLPDLAAPGGAAAALAAVAHQAAHGLLSPEEASDVARLVESYLKATELAELIRRIERLEMQNGAGPAAVSTGTDTEAGTGSRNGDGRDRDAA